MISFLRKSTVLDKMRIVSLPLYMIAPNPNQPRKYFEPQAMEGIEKFYNGIRFNSAGNSTQAQR